MGLKADRSNLEVRASFILRIWHTLGGVAHVSQDAYLLWLARLPLLRNLLRFPESGSLPNAEEQVLPFVSAEHPLIPSL